MGNPVSVAPKRYAEVRGIAAITLRIVVSEHDIIGRTCGIGRVDGLQRSAQRDDPNADATRIGQCYGLHSTTVCEHAK